MWRACLSQWWQTGATGKSPFIQRIRHSHAAAFCLWWVGKATASHNSQQADLPPAQKTTSQSTPPLPLTHLRKDTSLLTPHAAQATIHNTKNSWIHKQLRKGCLQKSHLWSSEITGRHHPTPHSRLKHQSSLFWVVCLFVLIGQLWEKGRYLYRAAQC